MTDLPLDLCSLVALVLLLAACDEASTTSCGCFCDCPPVTFDDASTQPEFSDAPSDVPVFSGNDGGPDSPGDAPGDGVTD